MNRISNQQKEHYYFELFRKVYPIPEGEVIYGDKPDVMIKGQRKIGIEVTNLYLQNGELPESEQNQKRVRNYVIQEAQKKFVEQGGEPFTIYFSFNSEHPIRKKEKLISKLVELATQIELSKYSKFPLNLYQDIPELSFVNVNHKIHIDPKWQVVQVHRGQFMSTKRLEDILRTKEKKAKHYTPCDDYWLLVVVDFINSAQDQEIPTHNNIKFQSNVFKKIVVYKTVYENLVEITTERITS